MASDSERLVYQLHSANVRGSDSEVLSLLQRGADPNSYWRGRTSLMNACWDNHPLTTQHLIKWGASLTMTGQYDGWTALHYACDVNSMKCVKILIEHHTPTDIKDSQGQTALDIARERGFNDIVEFTTRHQPLPRDPLSSYPSVKQLSELQVDEWSKLGLHLGLTEDEVGSTHEHKNPMAAMFLAAKKKNTELKWKHVIEGLVDIGEGRAVLPVCARHGLLDMYKYLVESVGLNPRDSGENPDKCLLHLACINGYLQFVKYLIIEKICDRVCINREGRAVLPVCARHGWLDMYKYLVESVGLNPRDSGENPDECLLHLACINGHLQFVKYLITEKICDRVCINREGRAFLLVCARHGWLDVFKYLVESVGLNPRDSGEDPDECLLHLACINGHLQFVKYLFTKKICDRVCINSTLLHVVRYRNRSKAEFLLNECHADPNTIDTKNRTPLALSTDPAISILLLKHGAKADNVYKAHSKHIGKLSSEGPLDNPLPVFITGDGGVGKSTFLKSMLSITSFFSFLWKPEPVTGVDEKTVGIIPYEVDTKEIGKVTIHDFAGQHEFYASHCAVLENAVQTSPPIITHLVDLQESEQKIVESIVRWLTLVQNQCTNLEGKAHVIVVGSHADILREKGKDPRDKEGIFAQIFENFPKLEFTAFVPMDCRYPDTDGMKEAKKLIRTSSAVLRSPETVSLNAHTFYIYLLDSFKDELAVSLKDVQQRIHRDLDQVQSKRKKNLLSFIPSTLPRLVEICEQLSEKGLILYLHNKENLDKSFIICDRPTLLSKITGTVFAPKSFRQHCDIASSTGVVPLSKFSKKFERYDTDMLTAFLSHFELCFEITDKVVLDCIRQLQQNPQPDGRYLFFPGLIRIETPENVWEEDSTMSCHFGWIIECSQDIGFIDPRCLQVLILRLVFTFGLAPARIEREHLPSLQRFCSVWKSGIFWCNKDGINSHLELSDNSKTLVLKMRSRVLKPEFLMAQSQIICKILETVKEFNPNVTIVESVIKIQEVVQHPLKPSPSLKLCSVSDIASAVALNKEDVQCERGSLALSQLLQFEPYAGLDQNTLQCIHSEKNIKKNEKISDGFIFHFANQVTNSDHIRIYIKILRRHELSDVQASLSSGSSRRELVDTLRTWRDKTEGTYSCLRETLNEYSIFTGRNPLDLAGVAHSEIDPSIFPEPPPEDCHQEPGAADHHAQSQLLDLYKKFKLSEDDLDKVVSDEHILEISPQLENWKRVAARLGLTPADIEAIEFRGRSDVELMRQEMLQKWKSKKKLDGTDTYRVLMNALIQCGCTESANQVCQLLA